MMVCAPPCRRRAAILLLVAATVGMAAVSGPSSARADGPPHPAACASDPGNPSFRRCHEILLSLYRQRRPALWRDRAGAGRPPLGESARLDGVGLVLSTITLPLAAHYGIPDRIDGAVVTGLARAGAAAANGLRVGDVVVEVAQETIRAPGDLAVRLAAARAREARSVLVQLYRAGSYAYLVIPVP